MSGGLPEHMNMKLVEPVRELFKDEVRKLGLELGDAGRHGRAAPFPGAGPCRPAPRRQSPKKSLPACAKPMRFTSAKSVKPISMTQIWQAFAVLLTGKKP